MGGRSKFPGARRATSARRIATPLAAAFLASAAMASASAHAGSVTFDWEQMSGNATATGTLTLSSSLLRPTGATGASQFSLMLAQVNAAGESVLGDVSAFTFSF